jgi:hypothetical protein
MVERNSAFYGNVCFVPPQKREKALWHEWHEQAPCCARARHEDRFLTRVVHPCFSAPPAEVLPPHLVIWCADSGAQLNWAKTEVCFTRHGQPDLLHYNRLHRTRR